MAYPGRHWKQEILKGFCLSISIICLVNTPSFSQEDPKEILAASVRQHGHVCDHPKSAKPDPQNTSPGEKAWILHCEKRAYKVKFTGDTGAHVEPVSE